MINSIVVKSPSRKECAVCCENDRGVLNAPTAPHSHIATRRPLHVVKLSRARLSWSIYVYDFGGSAALVEAGGCQPRSRIRWRKRSRSSGVMASKRSDMRSAMRSTNRPRMPPPPK